MQIMINSPMNIAILNHAPARDLPSTIPVGTKLQADYGHNVIIVDNVVGCSKWDWARRVQPDVIVFPKIIDPPRFLSENKNYSFAKEYDPYCIVMPTESGTPGTVGTERPLNGVDLYLPWNASSMRFAQQHYGINKESMELVGCPRYDIFAKKNQLSDDEILSVRTEYGISEDCGGPVVTVASSFPMADDILYNGLETRIDQGEEFNWSTAEHIIELAKIKYKARKKFIQMIINLHKGTDIPIALKIHPLESQKPYIKELNDLNRVSIVQDDYSARFLQISDIHIHHHCTTGIEAFMLDVPSIDFLPFEYDKLKSTTRGEGSIKLESIQEVSSMVRKVNKEEISIPEDVRREGRNFVEEHFTKIDGRRAEVTAETINNYIDDASKTSRADNNFIRGIYQQTGVDLFYDNQSISQYIKDIPMSIGRNIKYRGKNINKSGWDIPPVLTTKLSVEDIKMVKNLTSMSE
jgi:surface carbohydrate biosynthesis protein